MANQFDSRVRAGTEVMADLMAMGAQACRLTIVGSHNLEAKEVADGLREAWSGIIEMVGFSPKRVVTGCAPGGVEKAVRLAAKDLTGKLSAVFHRPDMTYGAKTAEMFMNVSLAKAGDALLILAPGTKPACKNIRRCFVEWRKPIHQVEIG